MLLFVQALVIIFLIIVKPIIARILRILRCYDTSSLRSYALCWPQLPNLQDMLGPEQGYDGMYGQGPPSVHSSHGGRGYQPQGNLYVSHFIHRMLLLNNRLIRSRVDGAINGHKKTNLIIFCIKCFYIVMTNCIWRIMTEWLYTR